MGGRVIDPRVPVEFLKGPFSFKIVVYDANDQVIEGREFYRVWLKHVQPPSDAAFMRLQLDPAPQIEIPPGGVSLITEFAAISAEEFNNCPVGVRQLKDW